MRRRQPLNLIWLRFLAGGKKLREERLEELNRRGLSIELSEIESIANSIVIEVSMLYYGTEFWLMNVRREDFELSAVRHARIGERRFLALENARVICNEGVPLKTRTLLRKYGVEPLKLKVRW